MLAQPGPSALRAHLCALMGARPKEPRHPRASCGAWQCRVQGEASIFWLLVFFLSVLISLKFPTDIPVPSLGRVWCAHREHGVLASSAPCRAVLLSAFSLMGFWALLSSLHCAHLLLLPTCATSVGHLLTACPRLCAGQAAQLVLLVPSKHRHYCDHCCGLRLYWASLTALA